MKRTIALVLAVLLLACLAGCGSKAASSAAKTSSAPASSKASSSAASSKASSAGASSKTSSGASKAASSAPAGGAPINFRPGVISASIGTYTLIALKADGGAVAVSAYNDDLGADVANWKNVAYVMAGSCYVLGIDKDGNVLVSLPSDAVLKEEWNSKSRSQVARAKVASTWRNVTEISDFNGNIVAVTKDGKCLHAVNGEDYQKKVDAVLDSWTDLKHVYAANNGAYGVKSDGTVVFVVGSNSGGFYDTSTPIAKWTGVERMAYIFGYRVGIKSDGTILLPNQKIDLNNEGAMKRAGALTNVADVFSNPSRLHSYDVVPLTKDGVFGEFSDVVAATQGDVLVGVTRGGTIVHTKFDDGVTLALDKTKKVTIYDGFESWSGLLVP